MTDIATRLRRLHYRAHHRGTREADHIVGGFFDTHHAAWGETEIAWFEALVEEQDVDIIAWAMGFTEAPTRWHGPMLVAMRRLDYVDVIP
jgi:antitoxin CptB